MINNYLKKKGIDAKLVKALWKKETGVFFHNIEDFKRIFPQFNTWIAKKLRSGELTGNGYNFSEKQVWQEKKEKDLERKKVAYNEKKEVNEEGKRALSILRKYGIKEISFMKEVLEEFLSKKIKIDHTGKSEYGKLKDTLNEIDTDGMELFVKGFIDGRKKRDNRNIR